MCHDLLKDLFSFSELDFMSVCFDYIYVCAAHGLSVVRGQERMLKPMELELQ